MDPDRILSAGPLELQFFMSARETYFEDEKYVMLSAFYEIDKKIAEATKG